MVTTNGPLPAAAGPVLVDGDNGYDQARAAWNLLHQHRPAVIIQPMTAHDVALTVNYAREQRLPVAVQATGHGQTVPADRGVLINTRNMVGLDIDKEQRTARVHAGVRWRAVLGAAAPYGLAPLVGSSITVGPVGYVTGGGLPVLGRTFGYAADHVRALEVVVPDGRQLTVTPEEHSDLFWAIRGGTCNFGVVTAAEIDLLPLPKLYGGQLIFAGEATVDVLPAWIEWCRQQPDEMNSSVAFMRMPDFPPELPGKFLIMVRIGYVGSKAGGEALVAPLRALEPVLSTVDELTIARLPEIHADPTDPFPVLDRSFRTREFDEKGVDRLVELAGPAAENPPTIFEIRHLGGVLGRAPRIPNAVGLRDAPWVVNVMTVTPDAATLEQATSGQDEIVERLRPWRAGGPHANFVTASAVAAGEVAEGYAEADYRRLREIKRQWDPDNMFRLNRNIPPADPH